MRCRLLRCFAFLLLPVCSALAAQEVPQETLGTPDAEFPTPFERVSEVRELVGGRLLVLESRIRTLHLIDFTTGSARRVGREGAGPGEYGYPLRLIALPADTSLVYDANNARFLVIQPDGSAGHFLDIGAPLGSQAALQLARLGPSVSSDSAGVLYFRGLAYGPAPEGDRLVVLDSAPLVRWNRHRNVRDTVAYVPLRPSRASSVGRGGVIVRRAEVVPFRTEDQWAVSSDGRLAIVYLSPYRVTMVESSGGLVRGRPLPHRTIRVSNEHKVAWREEIAALQPAAAGSGGTASALARYFEPSEWPEFLPPFLERAVAFAPNGSLWIRRTVPAGEMPSYDVISSRAELVERIKLSAGSRVVGFGTSSVYVIRRDADGLEHLQRFTLLRGAGR